MKGREQELLHQHVLKVMLKVYAPKSKLKYNQISVTQQNIINIL